MNPEPGSLAEFFDGWYADMTASPVMDQIQQRHLGLPPDLLSTSLLGWDGIAEAVAGLRLFPGGMLVDLACGRGGYGLEIAARTGARLTGVDFSAEAVRQAREHARGLGAPADPDAAALTAEGMHRHGQGTTQGARRLAALGALAPGITPERAAAVIAMMTAPASWRQLTQHSGWSFDEAETWLTASLTQLLLHSSR